MGEARQIHPKIATELALLLVLATLWGASYTFLKVAVATIPPVTLIAGRTLIAGLLLVAIMRWPGIKMPADAANWRRFLFQACLNSVIRWTISSSSCVLTPGTTWGTSASRMSAASRPAARMPAKASEPCSLIAPWRPMTPECRSRRVVSMILI